MSNQLTLNFANALFFGDNLEVLRRHVEDNSIDLIYLDPPFNSNKTYNVLFERKDGTSAAGQIKAFDDSWTWSLESARVFEEVVSAGGELSSTLRAFKVMLDTSDLLAYLTMLAPRLAELHRVLKTTGSIYLHCDPTASHYIKILMDAIFEPKHFRNEIIWSYGLGGSSNRYYPRKHDVLLFYTKTDDYYFNPPMIPATSQKMKGKMKKAPDVWPIASINNMAKERVGYPTQKPVALLERIIEASSRPGDLVLDPFCGCGTTVTASEELKRRWIGIDITKVAIDVIIERLTYEHGQLDYVLIGEPSTIDEAEALADMDKYEFQMWACRRIGAVASKKKGADRGIDGEFVGMLKDGRSWRGLVSVKGGKVGVAQVRDLRGTVERESADFGAYVSLKPHTAAMKREAADAGFTSDGTPRIQLLTVEQIFERGSAMVELPEAQRPQEKRLRLKAV